MVAAAKAHHGGALVNNRLQIDRMLPDLVEIAQGILGEILLEIDPGMGVLEQNFSPVDAIAIDHFDFGLLKLVRLLSRLLLIS